MRHARLSFLPLFVASFVIATTPASAQTAPPGGMVHTEGMQHMPGMERMPAGQPAQQGGQAAFASITEVVSLLMADSTTNWSKVNLEALRQHLVDMDNVTLHSNVQQTNTPGGLIMRVTGTESVSASVRRMVSAHAPMLESLGGWRASVSEIPGGIRLTVVASNANDSVTVQKIRGLGFIGLMTQGAHHAQHHLAIARGLGEHAHDAR